MNEKDRALMVEFKQSLSPDITRHVKRLVVFGSRVRGAAAEDSDLDLIILVDDKTPALERELDDAVYQVMWDHDFKPIISLKVFAESQFNDALNRGFSFYKHVDKEGVAV